MRSVALALCATLDLLDRRPLPAPDEVLVLLADPARVDEAGEAALRGLLQDDERARHDRFRFARHRREYLVTRALVRAALAGFTDVAPAALRFVAGPHGRPSSVDPLPVSFNLSNHPTLVVCAVARPCELGVDVEPLTDPERVLEAAETSFSPVERGDLAALPPESRPRRAVSIWTAKEAYIKARGRGVSLPLDGFAFRFEEEARPRLELLQPIDVDADFDVAIVDVEGHRVAVAARGLAGPIRLTLERADTLVATLIRDLRGD